MVKPQIFEPIWQGTTVDWILKKRLTNSGLAAVGLALLMKGLSGLVPPMIVLSFDHGISAGTPGWLVGLGIPMTIGAIAAGVYLLRRFVDRTGKWFVAAIVTWLLADMFLSGLDEASATLVLLAVTWLEFYLNTAPVPVSAVVPVSPAPVEDMNLIKTEAPAIAPQTDAQPLDPVAVAAAINVAPGKPLYSALGLVGAAIGAQLIVLGLMNTTFAAFDSLGDSFSGLPRTANQASDGANYQIIAGVILVGIGITVYTLFKGPKNAN